MKNAVVDDVNTVPENLRGLYAKQADGKFGIAESAKALVEMYTGTNTALTKANTNLAAANKESASRRVTGAAVVDFAKKLGLENVDEADPIATLETHYTELLGKVKGQGDLKVNLDNIKKDYERKNQELATVAAQQVATMQASLEKHLIGDKVGAALAKHGGNATLLTPLVKGLAKVVKDEDGNYSVRILDDTGAPRSNGAGGWLDLDGAVAELKVKPEYAAAFASESKGGTGHKPGSAQQQMQQRQTGEKTATEKIQSGLLALAGQGRVNV